MAILNAKNKQALDVQSSESSWVMIDGKSYKKQTDEHGEFIVKGGTEKVYLADYYFQKAQQEKKDKIQQGISGFFADQISDFEGWRDDYASKIGYWTKKINQNQSIYEISKKEAEAKEKELDPLYTKYNTFDISKFSDNSDKKLGLKLFSDKRSAKHAGNVALSQISAERSFVEMYRRLMNHSELCRSVVAKIANDCLNSQFNTVV